MKRTININRHIIASNKKNGETVPPISVKTYKSTTYGSKVDVLDTFGNVVATIHYTPDNPLSCGATAYITTNNEVRVS